MSKRSITLVMQDHDFLHPILCGDVIPSDLDLNLVRGDLRDAQNDESIPASELSFARHVRRTAEGDGSWVAMPAFVRRGFSHRAWFVRRDSGHKTFSGLKGARVGTNEWPASGNTWSRAAAREQGLEPTELDWVVGSIDGGSFGRADPLPDNVRYADSEEGLVDLLVRGDLDALMCPDPPSGFYEADSPVVRLFPDFRSEERAYLLRTGVFPAYHIVGLRRHVFEQDPSLALAIFDVLQRASTAWYSLRLEEGDTSPWLLADLEDTISLLGRDWQAYGVEANSAMMQYFCDEVLAQGLIERRVDSAELFADFVQLASSEPAAGEPA